jgi:hypothetical protein
VQKPPAETPEQQHAIVARLQEMLAADNELLESGNSSSMLCTQQPLPQQQAGEQQGDGSMRQPPSNTTAVYNGPRSQVNRTLTFLNSSRIAAGVDVARAGTLSWVSSPCMPPPYANENLVSDWDQASDTCGGAVWFVPDGMLAFFCLQQRGAGPGVRPSLAPCSDPRCIVLAAV